AAIAQLGQLKAEVKAAEERQKAAEEELAGAMLQIPLPPDEDVPEGRDESDNVVVRHVGQPRTFDFEARSHIDLARDLGLANFEAGVALAGSRSYFLTGRGAELHNAVLRFAIDMMTRKHGFTAATVPVLVREEALLGTGFFPSGR